MQVHCSNGGGRSGAFITIDATIDMLTEHQSIDIYGYCKKLNNMRIGLVESVEQVIYFSEIN